VLPSGILLCLRFEVFFIFEVGENFWEMKMGLFKLYIFFYSSAILFNVFIDVGTNIQYKWWLFYLLFIKVGINSTQIFCMKHVALTKLVSTFLRAYYLLHPVTSSLFQCFLLIYLIGKCVE
jgi:hypothetical protein